MIIVFTHHCIERINQRGVWGSEIFLDENIIRKNRSNFYILEDGKYGLDFKVQNNKYTYILSTSANKIFVITLLKWRLSFKYWSRNMLRDYVKINKSIMKLANNLQEYKERLLNNRW